MKKVLAIAVLAFFVLTSVSFAAKIVNKTNLLENPTKTAKVLTTLDANSEISEVTGEAQKEGYVKVTAPDKKIGWVLLSDTDIKASAPSTK